MKNYQKYLLLFALLPFMAFQPNQELPEVVGPDCEALILKIIQSAERVKMVENEIREYKEKPSFMLVESTIGQKGITQNQGKYVYKLGINGTETYETVTTINFYPLASKLTEIDWLTGEETPLDFDLSLLDKLPPACK